MPADTVSHSGDDCLSRRRRAVRSFACGASLHRAAGVRRRAGEDRTISFGIAGSRMDAARLLSIEKTERLPVDGESGVSCHQRPPGQEWRSGRGHGTRPWPHRQTDCFILEKPGYPLHPIPGCLGPKRPIRGAYRQTSWTEPDPASPAARPGTFRARMSLTGPEAGPVVGEPVSAGVG